MSVFIDFQKVTVKTANKNVKTYLYENVPRYLLVIRYVYANKCRYWFRYTVQVTSH